MMELISIFAIIIHNYQLKLVRVFPTNGTKIYDQLADIEYEYEKLLDR